MMFAVSSALSMAIVAALGNCSWYVASLVTFMNLILISVSKQ